MRLQREPCARLEEADQMGRQRVLISLRRQQFVEPGKALVSPGVLRSQNDFPSAARSDFATGQDVESNVYAHRAGMEKVQRPDVEGPAGQIGAARRCGNNLVAGHARHSLPTASTSLTTCAMSSGVVR